MDERFLIGQYRGLTEKLDDIHRKLQYLSKDVISEGPIFHNSAGRYEMLNGDYFTSGSRIELLVEDDDEDEDERTYWVQTTIEHNGDDYYAVALGRETSINGMTARLRRGLYNQVVVSESNRAAFPLYILLVANNDSRLIL